MTFRNILAGVVAATSLIAVPAAVAQTVTATNINGTLNDYVWVDMGGGAGPWQVSGTWRAKLAGDGQAEFVAAILGVRSDLWVTQTGADPHTTERAAHTHHVSLSRAVVTPIEGGVRLTGTAIITTNGSVAFSNASIAVDITGGDTMRFSNMKLFFLDGESGHFGRHAYNGAVTGER